MVLLLTFYSPDDYARNLLQPRWLQWTENKKVGKVDYWYAWIWSGSVQKISLVHWLTVISKIQINFYCWWTGSPISVQVFVSDVEKLICLCIYFYFHFFNTIIILSGFSFIIFRKKRLLERGAFKDENEINNHIKHIESENNKLDKVSRMRELENWLDYLILE